MGWCVAHAWLTPIHPTFWNVNTVPRWLVRGSSVAHTVRGSCVAHTHPSSSVCPTGQEPLISGVETIRSHPGCLYSGARCRMIETLPTDFILLTVSLSRLCRFVIGTTVPNTNPPKNRQKSLRPEAEKWCPRQKLLRPEAENRKFWQDWLGGMRGTNSPKIRQKLLRPEAEKWRPRQKLPRPEAENRKFRQDWLGGMRGLGRACSARNQ
jgi:hypothetical protein